MSIEEMNEGMKQAVADHVMEAISSEKSRTTKAQEIHDAATALTEEGKANGLTEEILADILSEEDPS